jgi:hypothetical protein
MATILCVLPPFWTITSQPLPICLSSKVGVTEAYRRSDTEYISDNKGNFTKDLWPAPMLAAVDGRPHEELETWQIVPITFAEICEWAYVCKKKRNSGPHPAISFIVHCS